MLWMRKVAIGDGERGLVFRNRRLERVLMPGVHRIGSLRDTIEVIVHDVTQPAYTGRDTETLIAAMGARLHEHFVLADIGSDEIGLVSRNGVLHEVLAPGTRTLYWRAVVAIDIARVALSDAIEVPLDVVHRLRQLGTLEKVAVTATVPEESAGLLFVDGTLVRVLAPGAHAFWNVRRNVAIEMVELRVQAMEVSGQELLTRDKVSLRVNLAASIRVVDPVVARTRVAKYADQVYRELQYGLRRAVSARTLDELLGDKASLDGDIATHVRERVEALGVEVIGVGIKDVILPGDMRDILNSVVQAEKAAQANVIRRREEANATRSLLNTARLIEESPVLMRLKELEALEKVTERVGQLTVFGGLEGVMRDLVTLKS